MILRYINAKVRRLYPAFMAPVLRNSGVLKMKNCMKSLANQNTEINPHRYLPVVLPSVRSSVLKIEKSAMLVTIRKIKNT